MSVSMVTDSYPSIDWSAASVTPAGTNVTGRERDALLAVAEVVVLAIILVMALLGNGLVLVVLLRRRRHHNPLHQFMLNLCVADLVVALFQLVWDAKGRFPGPDFLCRLVKYLQVLGMFASAYMIVAMTVDRHYAICCPLQAHRSGATQRWNSFVLLAWGLSLLLSLPQVFIFSRSEVAPGVYECWGNFTESWGLKAYVTWMTVAVFILPVLVITVCQVDERRDTKNDCENNRRLTSVTFLPPQVRIFNEIHNNLYLKSERRLSPTSLPPSRRDSQRAGGGGGGGGSRGRSSLPLYVSPLMFNNPVSHTSFDPGSTYQHLPMGPLRSSSIASHCDIHTYSAVHTADLQPDVLPDPAAPSAVCCPPPKALPARGGEVSAAMSKTTCLKKANN
ncbi:Vasopressin V2 receptor [Collichthys lucidus]|uniref:Vasopressin V2 receptor n=1 Tax=Collichthys lucidus TaxID=240159 RepID=A0A4U5UNJ1_COLLU|nr:Vasopressin V2 receptor [Collichthys lucidus]